MIAPKPSGFPNTKEGKVAILERTKKLIESSSLVISFPAQGVSKEQIDILRKGLPKTVKAAVVKNSLIRIASKDTPFEPIGSKVKQQNMFFFIPEGEAKPVFESFKKWQKEVKRTEPEFGLKFVVMEGKVYNSDQIENIVNLPTKKELIAKIAFGIKAIPTKVAKGIKGVPSKLGRAFVALRDKLEEQEKANQS
jgi:large subunit ribosomal protein L10